MEQARLEGLKSEARRAKRSGVLRRRCSPPHPPDVGLGTL